MRYLSVCSGIEAATVAWHPLGWEPVAFSEIEAFPRAVLAHHYPDVPCHGDFTTIGADDYGPIDLLVGGTPCQSFSIAGLRGGLADDRGNLALEFLRLAQRTRTKWLVWENVPGVLSSDGGRDFGSILGGLVELGYGFSYRVLDAQHFGVPQRRRRVFVVGYLGDWRRAAAVLFERHSLQGHTPPRRQAGQSAPTIPSRSTAGGGLGTDFDCDGGLIEADVWALQGAGRTSQNSQGSGYKADVCFTLNRLDEHAIAHSLRADGFDASEDGTGRGTPLVPVCIHADAMSRSGDCKDSTRAPGLGVIEDGTAYSIMASAPHAVAFDLRGREHGSQLEGPHYTANVRAASGGSSRSYIAHSITQDSCPVSIEELSPALKIGTGLDMGQPPCVAFSENIRGEVCESEISRALQTSGGKPGQGYVGARIGSAVRRLTPRECERLQGFPDDYTLVSYRGKPAADGPRYKALGNSMAVPVMRWIGERIAAVEALNIPLGSATTAAQQLRRGHNNPSVPAPLSLDRSFHDAEIHRG